MGTYYNDVKETTGFTEESLKKELHRVFYWGLAAFGLGGSTELDDAKNKCLAEIFAHMVEYGFPNLDELKSDGALQAYVDLLRRREACGWQG